MSMGTRFLNIFSEFQHMWDGHLGLIKAATRLIELTSIAERLIHLAPYLAGRRARREFEEYEIDKMLAMHVIEPATVE